MNTTQQQRLFFTRIYEKYYKASDTLLADDLQALFFVSRPAAYKRINGEKLLTYAEIYCLVERYEAVPINILFLNLKNYPPPSI